MRKPDRTKKTAGKGAPPSQPSSNLSVTQPTQAEAPKKPKPPPEPRIDFNFKVHPDFKAAFTLYATKNRMKYRELLEHIFNHYADCENKVVKDFFEQTISQNLPTEEHPDH